jgi:hypothetical protein
VHTVTSNFASSPNTPIPTNNEITSWLRSIWKSPSEELLAEYDQNDVIEAKASEILEKLSSGQKQTLSIDSSHCECVLLRHLHDHRFSEPSPYRYIAVSKLCCLLCFYYFTAYREYAITHPDKLLVCFEVQGSNGEVIACEPPGNKDEDDGLSEHLEKYMRSRVEELFVRCLETKLENVSKRKDSQSTNASEPCSDEDDFSSLLKELNF